MEQKLYLNNTTLEDLESIKKDIRNLNDYYSKITKKENNNRLVNQKKEINDNLSKQNEKEPKNPSNTTSEQIQIIKDSRKIKEPIIKLEYFNNFILKETKLKNTSQSKLSSFNYKSLSEMFMGCGIYPEEARKYIWAYLLSLPNNMEQFIYYSGKGIHPLYVNIQNFFPIRENQMITRVQKLCSLISFWSPNIGQVSYLPNIIFPFAKSFPGDDIFIFETVMSLLISVYKYLLEFYPNFPITHIKLIEEIIKKETCNEIEKIVACQSIPLNELIWRLLKYLFSETLKKNDWLSLVDFIITYNHHPEMLLYFTASFLICSKDELLSDNKSQKNLLLTLLDNKPIRKIKRMFDLSLLLYKKYSKSLQEFIYEPYIPHDSCTKYKTLAHLPMEFYNTIEQLRKDYYRGDLNMDINQHLIENDDYKNILERKYRELCMKEREIEYCQKDILQQEKRKNEILKWELALISHQRNATLKNMENFK
jgi:hypothetical protein